MKIIFKRVIAGVLCMALTIVLVLAMEDRKPDIVDHSDLAVAEGERIKAESAVSENESVISKSTFEILDNTFASSYNSMTRIQNVFVGRQHFDADRSCGIAGMQDDGTESQDDALTSQVGILTSQGEQLDVQKMAVNFVAASERKVVKNACPSKNGALKVKGTELVDKKGRIVQLRGMSTHGLAWFPQYVNQKCFKNLKKWGANVVRLAMYTNEYGGYCSGGDQKALEKLINNGVKYAKKADMYVIVDWHILSDGDPNIYKKQAKKFFKKITKSLSKYNNVIYEICNEPNGGTSWDQIKSYAKSVIKVIRKKAKKAVIIVGTPNWSQFVDQVADHPLSGKNIMYALHFYSGTHKEDLQNTMTAARKKGLPIFATEFGLCDASGNGNLDLDSGKKWLKLLDSYHISYVNWSLCNKGETASAIRPEVTKTTGFKKGELTDSGRWYFKWLKKKKS